MENIDKRKEEPVEKRLPIPSKVNPSKITLHVGGNITLPDGIVYKIISCDNLKGRFVAQRIGG